MMTALSDGRDIKALREFGGSVSAIFGEQVPRVRDTHLSGSNVIRTTAGFSVGRVSVGEASVVAIFFFA